MILRALVVLMLLAAAPAQAVPSIVFPFAGRLLDAEDHAVTGNYAMTFDLYDASNSQTPLWSETLDVYLNDGRYVVYLGQRTPIPDSVLDGALWLQQSVNTVQLQPRLLIATMPFAARSGNASKLGGLDAAEYVKQGAATVGVGDLNVSGKVGVGLAAGAAVEAPLHVNGPVLASAFNQISDERLKRDVRPIANARERVKLLKGVKYGWNERAQKEYGRSATATEIGVVAQDVERAFPELVTVLPNGDRSVDYGRLSAVLVEAVNAQDAEIAELRRSVADLKRAVERIGARK